MQSEWCRKRVNILGVKVSAIVMRDATTAIETWIRERTPNYVCVTGVHGVMASQHDAGLAHIHNMSGLTVPDGMPLVWMAHQLGFPGVERVYGPDLMLEMTALSARHGYRNFYYGGSVTTVAQLKETLERRYPGLNVVGAISPPFRPLTAGEDDELVAQITEARPDIVWVGLSTPKQERWMKTHVGRIGVPALVGVGAAFDFLSGNKRQAPRWMQRNGFEWLFRMGTEPRRLAGRYLRNNPAFVCKALAQIAAPHRYPQTYAETLITKMG
jgi:N-acetylglucosaminyldiphosphoundecaprenol N-acetyl-beta-D-mannosaminyltransferase